MNGYKDSVLNEEEILEIYKALNIDISKALDIERLGKEYQEAVAVLEREDYCTFAFVDNSWIP